MNITPSTAMFMATTTMNTCTPIPSKSATTATKTIAATLGINAWCVQIERQAQ